MDPPPATNDIRNGRPASALHRKDSQDSQTAADFINDQLQLEADAREALPYAFDTCTQPLGPLRQILFACLTCNPPPSSASAKYTPAGVCYSCSIACHGEHILVELFNKRDFVCDCGSSRLPPTSPCTLRINPETGRKGGVHSDTPAPDNRYNQNFRNRFCGCEREYDAEKQRGTMYQCLGLGTAEEGGCGEDWWHPSCVVGLGPDWKAGNEPEEKAAACEEAEVDDDLPPPPGFPDEDDFEAFICYKCVDANPWIKRYAGTEGFLPPVFHSITKTSDTKAEDVKEEPSTHDASSSRKRKAEDEAEEQPATLKKAKSDKDDASSVSTTAPSATVPKNCHYATLPPAPTGVMSLFLKSSFRDQFCRCAACFPWVARQPQLLEEEVSYEPPLSEDGDEAAGGSSVGTGSLLDRGERALSNVDRVRAIEGVMVYNHLKDKVKTFLQPFAETGQAVGAEDIKAYFEKLRGDAEAVRAAGVAAAEDGKGDNRREQSGESPLLLYARRSFG
ncbi:MAG: hypothetical protein M1832_002288 [Thelocarpon impressellum]|nr:MAG: hypothetical protein M1832_002288 [Thelocarpon impressellum]